MRKYCFLAVISKHEVSKYTACPVLDGTLRSRRGGANVVNSYEKVGNSRNTAKRSALTSVRQVHIEQGCFFCYLLLFDSLSVVYEGLCGKIFA